MPYAKCKDASIVASWAVGGEVRNCARRGKKQGRIQKIQKEGTGSPSLPLPQRENLTFQDMQHTALWAYS